MEGTSEKLNKDIKKSIITLYLSGKNSGDIANILSLRQVDVLNYLKEERNNLVYKQPTVIYINTIPVSYQYKKRKHYCFYCLKECTLSKEWQKEYGFVCKECVNENEEYYNKLLNFTYFE